MRSIDLSLSVPDRFIDRVTDAAVAAFRTRRPALAQWDRLDGTHQAIMVVSDGFGEREHKISLTRQAIHTAVTSIIAAQRPDVYPSTSTEVYSALICNDHSILTSGTLDYIIQIALFGSVVHRDAE